MSVSEKYAGPALAVAVITIALVLAKRMTLRRLPYPPGPKGYPIIGNLLDFPRNPVWEGLTKVAQAHGEPIRSRNWCHLTLCSTPGTGVVHFDIMGIHLVALNDSEVAAKLMEQRTYSDRVREALRNTLHGRCPHFYP